VLLEGNVNVGRQIEVSDGWSLVAEGWTDSASQMFDATKSKHIIWIGASSCIDRI